MNISKRQIHIGGAPSINLPNAIRSSTVALKEAVESEDVYDWDVTRLNDFYLMAWALVHFIELSHQAGYVDLRPLLKTYLRPVLPPFEATFGTSYEQIQRELLRYTRNRTLPSIKLPRPQVSLPPASWQCLNDSDRDFELAVAMMIRNPQQALRILQELHASSPSEARYLIELSSTNNKLNRHAEALSYAEQAITIAPEDASAQIEYASRLVHGCILIRAPGCAQAWKRAVKLFRSGIRSDPQRFDAVLGLGLSYLHSGRPGDALNYLKIAYQKAPWAPQINFYLGECYRLIGDRRAVAHLTNARNWSTEEIWKRLADAALTELE